MFALLFLVTKAKLRAFGQPTSNVNTEERCENLSTSEENLKLLS